MFKRISLGLLLVLASILSAVAITPVVSASNEAGEQACTGLESLGVDCNANGKTAEEIAKQPLQSLIRTFSIVIGAVAVIMIIYGGFKFITSGGDADKNKSARNTIIYAAIGLAIVVMAQTIVYFVFRKSNDLQTSSSTSSVLVIDKG